MNAKRAEGRRDHVKLGRERIGDRRRDWTTGERCTSGHHGTTPIVEFYKFLF